MSTIEIATGDYKMAKGDETLFTTGLEGCVGVAVFKKSDLSKRGLAHIYFGGGVGDIEPQSEMAKEQMEEMLGRFIGKKPNAILAATPFKYTKGKTYKNEMLDFLREYLEINGINIQEVDDEKIVGNVGKVNSKDMILTPEEVRIIYRNAQGGCGSQNDMRRIKF